jgi:hypothetical protein
MANRTRRPDLQAQLCEIGRAWSEIRKEFESSDDGNGGRGRQADQRVWDRAKKVWGVFAKWAAKVADKIGRDHLPSGPMLPSPPGGRWHEATWPKYCCGADSTQDAGKLLILWGAVFNNPQKFHQTPEARALIERWLWDCIFLEREGRRLAPLMDWVAEVSTER